MNLWPATLPIALALGLFSLGTVYAENPILIAADASRATEVSADGAAALVRVLQAYHTADNGEGGFVWWRRLPFAVRAQQVQRPEVRLWRDKLEFMYDAQRGDAAACAISGAALLKLPMPVADAEVERKRLEQCAHAAR